MKKRLYILFLSLFSVSGVTSAQEVFNKVMESAQHILNEPTSTFTNTQIAKFKVDELNYMKGKAMEKDSVAAIDLLDVQSYYMSEFLSMFYTEIIYSTDLSAEDRKAKILLFIQASCACPLFNDTDKEKINILTATHNSLRSVLIRIGIRHISLLQKQWSSGAEESNLQTALQKNLRGNSKIFFVLLPIAVR